MLSSIWKVLISREFRIVIIIAGIIGNYMAYKLHYGQTLRGSRLEEILRLENLTISEFTWMVSGFTGTIAVSLPVLLDALVDLKAANQIPDFYERMGIVLANMLLGIVFYSAKHLQYFPTFYVCTYYTQRIIWAVCVFSVMSTYVPEIFTPGHTFLINLWITFPQVVDTYSCGSPHPQQIMGAIKTVGLIYGGFLCGYWTYSKIGRYPPRQWWYAVKSMNAEELSAAIYIYSWIIILVYNYLYFFLTGGAPGWLGTSVGQISDYCFCTSVYVVIITVLPGRLARHQAQKLRHDLDMKHSYVKHISHEMLTPLNIVSTGLQVIVAEQGQQQLHQQQIQMISQNRKSQSRGTISNEGDETQPLLLESTTSPIHNQTTTSTSLIMSNVNETTELHKSLLDACDEMSRVLKNLLDDTVNVAMVTDMVDIGTFLQTAFYPYKSICRQKHITFSLLHGCVDDLRGKYIKIDSNKITQVLRDMASNAVKFTPEGGFIRVTANITTFSSKNHEEQIQIRVKDSGIGISKEHLGKVYNQPIQINPKDDDNGTGMSLTVAKSIIQLHNGTCGLESAGIGQGCTFFIQLPVQSSTKIRGHGRFGHAGSAQIGSTGGHTARTTPNASISRIVPTILRSNNGSVDAHDSTNDMSMTYDGPQSQRGSTIAGMISSAFGGGYMSYASVENRSAGVSPGVSNQGSRDISRSHSFTSQPDGANFSSNTTAIVHVKPKSQMTDSDTRSDTHSVAGDTISLVQPSATPVSLTAASLAQQNGANGSFPDNVSVTSNDARSGVSGTSATSAMMIKKSATSLHVLVVDDSQMNRKVVGRLVKVLGHTFDEAEDGQFCVDMIRHSMIVNTMMNISSAVGSNGTTGAGDASPVNPAPKLYDAVLIDNFMPRMTGPEAVHLLRTNLHYRGAIIGITGNVLPEDVEEFTSRGAQRILAKPITATGLQSALDSCLEDCYLKQQREIALAQAAASKKELIVNGGGVGSAPIDSNVKTFN